MSSEWFYKDSFVHQMVNISSTFVFQYNMMGESSELFVNCLEAMVETCLPVEEPSCPVPPSPRPGHLSSSLSSLTIGSPTDKGIKSARPSNYTE